MLRKIILHGQLKRLFPEPVSIDAQTVAEAIRGLCVVSGGAFDPTPQRGRIAASVAGFDTYESLSEPLTDDVDEIHIFPALRGGKSGGVMQVVIGAVLIVVGVILSFTPAAAASPYLYMMGASMMLGGVISMLSPTPKVDTGGLSSDAADPEASRYLGSPQNTTKIGTRIPILYGRTLVYGHILSFGLQAKDVSV